MSELYVQGDFLNENPMNSVYEGRAGALKWKP
jgi:hypothetical protein